MVETYCFKKSNPKIPSKGMFIGVFIIWNSWLIFSKSVNSTLLDPTVSPVELFIPTKVILLFMSTNVLGNKELSFSIDTSEPVSMRNCEMLFLVTLVFSLIVNLFEGDISSVFRLRIGIVFLKLFGLRLGFARKSALTRFPKM